MGIVEPITIWEWEIGYQGGLENESPIRKNKNTHFILSYN